MIFFSAKIDSGGEPVFGVRERPKNLAILSYVLVGSLLPKTTGPVAQLVEH